MYYDAEPVIKIKDCKSKYIKSSHFEPKTLDGRQDLILSNLPKPWTLVCGAQKRPFLLKYSTLRIINRTGLCECSLTAGAFHITQTVKSCSLTNILSDATFTTYYVFNKIIFDTLAEQYQIFPDKNIQNIMSNLLQDIPVYNWKPLNWSNSSYNNNILEDTEIIYEAELDDVLQLIVDETEEKIYKDTADFETVKHNFEIFFQKAQMWEKFSVVCSWLGLLDLIILLILFFYAKSIILKIISGLEIIQNYDIIKTSQALPTERVPIFTLPTNFPHTDMIQPHEVTISTLTIIVIRLMSMILLLTIYRNCRYVFCN